MNQYLWVIFSLIFLFLFTYHLYQSRQYIKKIENKAMAKTINGLNLGVGDFINDFNIYIENLNRQNKKINIATSLGYLVAFLTSIYSFYLSL